MTLTHGADTAALKKSGEVLRRKAGEVDDLTGQATRAAKRLATEWRGSDSDAFARSWQKASKGLTGVGASLTQMAKTLDSQAKGQEQISEELSGGAGLGAGVGAGAGAGAGAGDASGGGAAAPDGVQAYIAPMIDGWDDESQPHPLFPSVSPEDMWADKSTVDGTLDPAVEERWHQMSREEKEETIHALVRERADANGIEVPTVEIGSLIDPSDPDKNPPLGYWNEQDKVMAIQEDQLNNPRQVIAIIGHEMRHAGQHEMVRDSDMGWIERTFTGRHFDGGLSEEQIEIIRQNNEPGEYRQSDEDGYNAYHYQPVEADARNAGKEYVDGMTVEQLEGRRSLLDYLGPMILPRRVS